MIRFTNQHEWGGAEEGEDEAIRYTARLIYDITRRYPVAFRIRAITVEVPSPPSEQYVLEVEATPEELARVFLAAERETNDSVVSLVRSNRVEAALHPLAKTMMERAEKAAAAALWSRGNLPDGITMVRVG